MATGLLQDLKGAASHVVSTASQVASTASQVVSTASSYVANKFYRAQFRMLLIGETGSGKTSFLNLLCNSELIEELGRSSADEKTLDKIERYNDLTVEDASDRAMASKTSEAKMYHTEVCALKITVIDTPGFGDSRGLEQDKKNVGKIIEMLNAEAYINCVCLVINGRQSRMSASLKYVLSEISSILPKEIFNNIIVVFTNTADPLDCNFDVGELTSYFGSRKDHDFYIENPYCRIEKAKQKKNVSSDKIIKSLRKSFVDTAECLSSMKEKIAKFEKVHTYHFTNLFEKKQAIERDIIKLLAAYDEQTQLAKEIKDTEEEVEAALKTKNLHNDFKTTKIVKVMRPVDTPDKRHNTLCGAPGCYSNCHMPCYLEKSFDKEAFKSCASMGGTDTCKKCSHSYRVHYHNEVYFTEVEERQEIIDEKMKEKFKEAQSMEEKAQILRDGLNRQQRALMAQKAALSQQLKVAMSEFKRLALTDFNYAKLLEQQRDVIVMRIEEAIGPEVKHLKDVKEDIDKRLKIVYDAIKPQRSFKF